MHVQNLAMDSNCTTSRSLSAHDDEYRGLQVVQIHMVQTYSPRAEAVSNYSGPRISVPLKSKLCPESFLGVSVFAVPPRHIMLIDLG